MLLNQVYGIPGCRSNCTPKSPPLTHVAGVLMLNLTLPVLLANHEPVNESGNRLDSALQVGTVRLTRKASSLSILYGLLNPKLVVPPLVPLCLLLIFSGSETAHTLCEGECD